MPLKTAPIGGGVSLGTTSGGHTTPSTTSPPAPSDSASQGVRPSSIHTPPPAAEKDAPSKPFSDTAILVALVVGFTVAIAAIVLGAGYRGRSH